MYRSSLIQLRYKELTDLSIEFIDKLASDGYYDFALILCDHYESNHFRFNYKLSDIKCYCLLRTGRYESARHYSKLCLDYFNDDKFRYYFGQSLLYTNSKSFGIEVLNQIHIGSELFDASADLLDNYCRSIHKDLSYDKSDFNRLKIKNECIKSLNKSYSQAFQDLFVLSALNKIHGTYLEFGAADPVIHNNTYNLELLGWKGESIEFNQLECDRFRKVRLNKVHCLNALEFDFDDFKSRFGDVIDYLQVDLEPPTVTFNVLCKAIESGITFRCVTFEHDRYNGGEEVVNPSREFMKSHGYELVAANVSYIPGRPFEDWYMHELETDPFSINGMDLTDDVEHNILDIFF